MKLGEGKVYSDSRGLRFIGTSLVANLQQKRSDIDSFT